jgi:Putative transposase
VLDGVYGITGEGEPVFHPAPAPSIEQLQTLLDKIIKRIMKLLMRLGHLIEEEGVTYVADGGLIDPDNVLTTLQAASSTYRIAMGPRAGRKVLSLQYAPRRAAPTHTATVRQRPRFQPARGVRCEADQRGELELLCRDVTRLAIANERLSVNRAGQVVLKLKTAYRNGTTHIEMSPLEFMQRLAALVPRPRLHLTRFHGVLAPNAKLRSQVVPTPAN